MPCTPRVRSYPRSYSLLRAGWERCSPPGVPCPVTHEAPLLGGEGTPEDNWQTFPAEPVHASPHGWLRGFRGPLHASVLRGAWHSGRLVSPEGLVLGRQVLGGGQKT